MSAHKSINVVLVFIAFILAVVTASLSQKDANDIKDLGNAAPDKSKNIVHLNNTSIATAVFSAGLLLLAFGAFHFNTKNFAMVKGVLCLVVLILGFVLIGFSGSLVNFFNEVGSESKQKNYANIGVAAGVFSLLAVGSCSLTVVKMLK